MTTGFRFRAFIVELLEKFKLRKPGPKFPPPRDLQIEQPPLPDPPRPDLPDG